MPARAGVRQEFVSIERKMSVKDAVSGRFVPSWENFVDAWAQVLFKGGNQSGDDDRHVENRSVVFVILYNDNVDPSMRVFYEGSYYAIQHTNNWRSKNRTELYCTYAEGSTWS